MWTRQDGVVAVAPVIDLGDRDLLAIGVSQSQEAEIVLAPLRMALHDGFGTPEGVPDGIELRWTTARSTGAACAATSARTGTSSRASRRSRRLRAMRSPSRDPDHEDGADLGKGPGERTGTPRGPGGVAPHLQPPAAARVSRLDDARAEAGREPGGRDGRGRLKYDHRQQRGF